MLIHLIRHGATAYNPEGRYQGTGDIPLSPAGRAALRPPSYIPEVVYTSPLCRAVETARILFPSARLVPVPDLRELDFGKFEGRTCREMEHDPDYRIWVEGGCLGRCPGGEDRATFTTRSCAAFRALLDGALSRGEQQLTIVAHGGTQMAVLSHYARPHRDFYEWYIPPGGCFLLDSAPWAQDGCLDVLGQVRYTWEE